MRINQRLNSQIQSLSAELAARKEEKNTIEQAIVRCVKAAGFFEISDNFDIQFTSCSKRIDGANEAHLSITPIIALGKTEHKFFASNIAEINVAFSSPEEMTDIDAALSFARINSNEYNESGAPKIDRINAIEMLNKNHAVIIRSIKALKANPKNLGALIEQSAAVYQQIWRCRQSMDAKRNELAEIERKEARSELKTAESERKELEKIARKEAINPKLIQITQSQSKLKEYIDALPQLPTLGETEGRIHLNRATTTPFLRKINFVTRATENKGYHFVEMEIVWSNEGSVIFRASKNGEKAIRISKASIPSMLAHALIDNHGKPYASAFELLNDIVSKSPIDSIH